MICSTQSGLQRLYFFPFRQDQHVPSQISAYDMSVPQGIGNGNNLLPNLAALSVGGLNPGQRRLAVARAARPDATREEIEAQVTRGNVQQIAHHMNRTLSHSVKRARSNTFGRAHRIYEDDSYGEEERGGLGEDSEGESQEEGFELNWEEILAREDLQNANMFVLAEFHQTAQERIRRLRRGTAEWQRATAQPRPKKRRFDLLASLCTCTELIVEVGKHMRPVDIVNLYSVSKAVRVTVDDHMRSCVFAWARHMAPTSARIFSSPVFWRWFIEDPAGRLVTAADRELSQAQPGQAKPILGEAALNDDETQVRRVPGLRWLQMVVHREIRVRDIIATLARKGHRLPEGAHLTLKKIWVLMDVGRTAGRVQLMNDPDFFSDEDLYIAQLFMVKLVLAFNHPNFGPQSSMLMRLMMGQRGLSPLWKLLRGKQYRTAAEIRQLKLRYDFDPRLIAAQRGMPLHGISVDQLGVLHREGWGTGTNHLLRPDELIPLEAARRQLNLDNYVEEMMLFGHVDFNTGQSLVPSLDEMYMSDDELPPLEDDWKSLKQQLIRSGCGNVPFEPGMWQPKHARKARWKTLTDEEKAAILEAEQEEIDEVKQLDGVFLEFQTARAKLLKMAMEITYRTKQGVKDKYRVPPPSAEDLQDQLDQFNQPKRLQLAINEGTYHTSPGADDAMDVDSEHASTAQHTAAENPDDLSTIPDESLDLEPIPQAELRRIFAAFRPRNSPRDIYSESDTDSYPSSEREFELRHQVAPFPDMGQEDLLHQLQALQASIQQPQAQPQPAQNNENGDGDGNDNDNDMESLLSSIDEDEDLSAWLPVARHQRWEPDPDLPQPRVVCQDPQLYLHAPVSRKPELVDKMLLAQADEPYSDDKYNGQGLVRKWKDKRKGKQNNEDRAAAEADGDGDEAMADDGRGQEGQLQQARDDDADRSEVDWDDFLNNPGAYVLGDVGGSVAAAALERADDENEEDGEGESEGEDMEEEDGDDDDDGKEDMDGWDADREDDDMSEDELEEGEEEEEEAEEDDQEDAEIEINVLVEGIQGGLALNDDQQEEVVPFSDSELDSSLYTAPQNVGEDERTRRLRDWYRPW
ncbi:uncharacterized protein B0T15DRAFT_112482 [Chaetomium strumarium]|uniref:Uncharacterized protein n=1 Tax=Chaetomium strumarium TaxID=1170767 RepID=A0AAJ0GZG4_9PEZI|nr:hypothetical protein B0T15DRAFT_112482 [Chaetomium strumarium]